MGTRRRMEGFREMDGRVIGFPIILEIAPFAPSSAGGKPPPFHVPLYIGGLLEKTEVKR